MRVWITCGKTDGKPDDTVEIWSAKPVRSTKYGARWAFYRPAGGGEVSDWRDDGPVGQITRKAFERAYKGKKIGGGEIIGPIDLRFVKTRGARKAPPKKRKAAVAKPPVFEKGA